MNRQLVLLICDTERYKPQVVVGREGKRWLPHSKTLGKLVGRRPVFMYMRSI